MLTAIGAALFAVVPQACTRSTDTPLASRSEDDVAARTSKLLSSGDASGVTTWGGPADDRASAVARDAAGNIYVVGTTDSFGAGGSDILILKYGSTGLEWARTWG
ncbi:MAG TPA: SBBP repeat-containing protein, partial [Polyangia bacterium]|nr:SBBP repeat-containing protein [Polyangia bacterium]